VSKQYSWRKLTCRGKHQCQEWHRSVWYQLWSSWLIETAQQPCLSAKLWSEAANYEFRVLQNQLLTWLTVSLSLTLVFLSSELTLSTCRNYYPYPPYLAIERGTASICLYKSKRGSKPFCPFHPSKEPVCPVPAELHEQLQLFNLISADIQGYTGTFWFNLVHTSTWFSTNLTHVLCQVLQRVQAFRNEVQPFILFITFGNLILCVTSCCVFG
jgi:hypothetical protein